MAEPVSVVLVAVGGYGEAYLSSLLDGIGFEDVRLVGAVEPAPERCSRLAELRELGVPLYGRLEEFYEEHTADLAVISSPIQFHCPQTCRALQRGSNVLCEKPLGATFQEVGRMQRARDAADRFVAIGYQWSFSDEIQRLKADIRAGTFGRPKRLRTLVLWPRDEAYYGRNAWAGAVRDGGGRWVLDSPVNNATAHFLHNMFYCLGETWNVSARPERVMGELYRANDIENYDTAALRCHTENGVEILFYSSHGSRELLGPVFSYEFERGTVALDGLNGQVVARFGDGTERNYGTPDNGAGRKLTQCLEACRSGGTEIACPIEAAAAQTLCMNGLQDSAPGIIDFPGEMMRVEDAEPARRLWVAGLQEDLVRCYREAILPSEAGLSWAVAGRELDLTGYSRYPGG
ncbi:MAG: Gfo/Idh/MocA family oxidoreductase [Candidatus Brocadiaceae bacterium]|jgi:predicted dehydrogenase